MNEELAIEKLKKDVIQKLGRTLDAPTDFDYLVLQVRNLTGEEISASTLKRFFGYIPTKSSISRSSLSILTRYIGFAGWSDYITKSSITSNFFSDKVIMAEMLHEGDMIDVEWKPNRSATFVTLGGNRFVVKKSCNSHLLEDDTMEIAMFALNQPLQVKNVIRNGDNIGHYTAGMDGGLTKVLVYK